MSFVPEFAPDALSQWRELEPGLQELVLDGVEHVLAHPPAPPVVAIYHDVYRADEHAEDYVFIRIIIDRLRGKMIVAGVVHYVRPKQQ